MGVLVFFLVLIVMECMFCNCSWVVYLVKCGCVENGVVFVFWNLGVFFCFDVVCSCCICNMFIVVVML